MECLKNYIQIEGCGAPVYTYTMPAELLACGCDLVAEDGTPLQTEASATPSGLYINKDLPITIKQMDKVADETQQTFLGLWDEVQNRGIKKFVLRVKTGYRELYNICKLDDSFFCLNRAELAMPLLYFLGAELMTAWIYSDRVNRYTTIDKEKAIDIREYCEAEFPKYLRTALENINDGTEQQTGDVFTYVEGLP